MSAVSQACSVMQFENLRDSADCVQLSSIMGSSLLSEWEWEGEGEHVNITEMEP